MKTKPTAPKNRWLKASFEAVSARKVFETLEVKFGSSGGNDGVVVFWTAATPEEVCEAIWELNGGCWCEVVEIHEDEADKFL